MPNSLSKVSHHHLIFCVRQSPAACRVDPFFRRALAMMLIGSVLSTLPACRSLTHRDARVRAERRWNHVRARVKLQLAQKQYQGGLMEDARQAASESLALDPHQTDAYTLLARVDLERGKVASAERALRTAEKMGLTSPELIYTHGVILEQRDQMEEALRKYATARLLDPANMDYLVANVECLVALDREKQALALLDSQAEVVDDEEGTIPILAARIALLGGDVQAAQGRYHQAVGHAGTSQAVAQDLGLLLVHAKRYTDAVEVLEPFILSEDDREAHGPVRRALAHCYLALNHPEKAKEILAGYAPKNPSDTAAQVLLAKAAMAVGDKMTALEAVDRAEHNDAKQPEVRLVRAVLQWQRGKLVAAAATLQALLIENPYDVDLHCLLAEVRLAQQRPERAKQHFQQALRLDPRCVWASAGLRSLG